MAFRLSNRQYRHAGAPKYWTCPPQQAWQPPMSNFHQLSICPIDLSQGHQLAMLNVHHASVYYKRRFANRYEST